VLASRDLHELQGRPLAYGLVGGTLNALGGLLFAYVLTRRTRVELAEDVMILLIVQVALNAAWAAYQTGAVSWRLAIGTLTALLTIVLLR
jgi:tryptophan-rich sensory protein